MLFNSHIFLFLFLPLVLVGFYLLGAAGRRRGALVWLTTASLFFYGWWEPSNLLLILCSMIWNFSLGRVVSSARIRPDTRRMLLIAGIAGNLALLGYFKYASFAVEMVNGLLGTTYALQSIILPLGISFFTFQQISYLVDTYRGVDQPHNFLHYCLFVTFFPHLIAGPLVHHGEMLPQFAGESAFRPNRRNLEIGSAMFAMGLFKKAVLADSLAQFASPVFTAIGAGTVLSPLEAWRGALAYTLQLYFDFSGYSDMAIGLAWLFGIQLPLNFNSPYKATSIIEFWRRWHMTLSRFLRDYLYIPLGGSRRGALRQYANLFITMVLAGLWHGAGWTYVAFGAMQGAYLLVNQMWRSLCKAAGWHDRPSKWWGRILSGGITFVTFIFSLMVFRSESFSSALSMLQSMCWGTEFALPQQSQRVLGVVPGLMAALEGAGVRFSQLAYFSAGEDLTWIAAGLSIVWLAPNTQEIMNRWLPQMERLADVGTPPVPTWLTWRPNALWAVAMTVVSVVALLHLSHVSEFLYFQF